VIAGDGSVEILNFTYLYWVAANRVGGENGVGAGGDGILNFISKTFRVPGEVLHYGHLRFPHHNTASKHARVRSHDLGVPIEVEPATQQGDQVGHRQHLGHHTRPDPLAAARLRRDEGVGRGQ